MQASKHEPVVSLLIGGLPRGEREQFLKRCRRVELLFGAVLCEPGQAFSHVYFPLTSFISLAASISGRPPLEMRLIGNEGMLGATLVLGVNAPRLTGVVQGSGGALRMSIAQFRRELRQSPGLQRAINRYVYVLLAQLSQTAACNRFHEVGPRLARWLLMTHDRAHADRFFVTHEFLARMLGVQRSAVTIAAGILQKRRLIAYTRGQIRVLDRLGLEAVSCECYEAHIHEYAAVFA